MVTAKYIAGGALVALVVASLAFSTWYFKGDRDDTRLKLQEVTRTLTQEREQHDSFVNEQTLLRDILDAGHKANAQAQEAHSEAIKKHRTEGTRVIVSDADVRLLHEYSTRVREAASGG